MLSSDKHKKRNKFLSLGQERLFIVVLVIVHLTLGSFYAFRVPVFEKPDESEHFAYITYLIDNGTLPPLVLNKKTNPALQIAGHPPLYYGICAAFLELSGAHKSAVELKKNPFPCYLASIPGTVNDNKNSFIHRSSKEWNLRRFGQIYLLRILSLLLGIVTMLFTWRLGHIAGMDQIIRLSSTALVALSPEYLFISSSISNDVLVTVLSSVTLWLLLKIISLEQPSKKSWALFGVSAGFTALSKSSGLLLLFFGITIAVVTMTKKHRFSAFLGVSVVILLGFFVVAGWWYLRNGILFDDPLGLKIHRAFYGRTEPLPLSTLTNRWFLIERSFWAEFGWGCITLPPYFYWGTRAGELLALAGLLYEVLRPRIMRNTLAFASLILFVALTIGDYLLWDREVMAPYGRLLFPALAPIAVMLSAGLRRWTKLATLAFVVWIAVLAVVSPLYIDRAFHRPDLVSIDDLPPSIHRTNIRMGEVAKLVGFSVSPRYVWPGESTEVTLCWEPISRTTKEYSIFIHVVGEKDKIIAGRHSIPGRGSYPTSVWRPGKVFCDKYMLRIPETAKRPSIYEVVVGLFDPFSKDRTALPSFANGHRLGMVSIGEVKIEGLYKEYPPRDAEIRPPYNFSDFILLVGAKTPRVACVGQPLSVKLYWKDVSKLSYRYTVFVHIVNKHNKIIAQEDSQPKNGKYPTIWWEKGDIIEDTHVVSIPGDISASGELHAIVGLYRLDNGARLKLLNGGDSVNIGTLEVKKCPP